MANKPDSLTYIEEGRYAQWETDPETGETTYRDQYGRTRAEVIEDYQDNANRLNAISGVYQRADRIITRDGSLTVTVVDDKEMDAPAQSNGKEIVLNSNLIEDLNADTITSLHGINYHEVAHVLFSPRAGSDLARYIKQNKLLRATQFLEEGRAEKLLTAKYPSTKLFLEATAMEYLLKDNPSAWGDQFAVLTGRTYLSLDIRQAVADKFIAKYGVALANRVHAIVHEYRTLVFPRDFDRAKQLLSAFAEIVGYDQEDKQPSWGKDICKGDLPTKGRPESQTEQERLQGKTGTEPTEEIAPTEGAGGSDTPYSGEDIELTNEDSLIADKLTERMKQIKSNPIVKREITETRKAINNSDEMRTAMKRATIEERSPSPTARSLARRFGAELERLVRDSDPHWERFLPSGKLNISRTMNPDINSIDRAFDVWDLGNERTEIEAVVLMDNSSSMGGLMRSVSENAWVIKRGIESIQGSVTVYSFCHESKVVYDKGERTNPNLYRYVESRGSTNPIRALIEAERLLTTSKKPIKIAFIITDGEWESSGECNSIIDSLNNMGVITCVVFLDEYGNYANLLQVSKSESADSWAHGQLKSLRHNAQIFRAVATPTDVLKLATALVKETLTPTRRR